MEGVEGILREFGLTEYEVRAYITLLRLRISTAEQISDVGSIPLPRVYDTLTELKKKGFVLISKTRPKKFRPIAPEKALNNLIEIKKNSFEEGMKSLEESVKKVNEALSEFITIETPKEEDVFTVWSTEKRMNVVKSLNEQLDKAKKEVLCFAGDMSWLPECIDSIKSALKRNINIKILARELSNSKEFLKNVKKARKLGLRIKTGYNGVLRGYIVDNEAASLAIKTSDKGVNIAEDGTPKTDVFRRYELITIENSVIAQALKENFKFWWDKIKASG